MTRSRGDRGRFAYEGLDRLFHERARLAILTTLASRPAGVLFSDLKALCALTDGNLSRHLKLLRGARVIEVWKRAGGARPQSLVRLTTDGRERFLAYLDVLETVVRDAAEAARREAAEKAQPSADGGPGFLPA
jgi:DNA-binding transcriptional ArsR family regulator